MNSNQVRAGAVSLTLVFGMLGGSGAANADTTDETDLSIPCAVLSAVPEQDIIKADTASDVAVDESPSGETHDVLLSSPTLEQSTSLTIDNGSGFDGTMDDFAVFHDADDQSTTMVRASQYGGQVIFAAGSETGLQDFILEFGKEIEDTSDIGEGEVGVRFVDGTSIAVQEPWARDGDGRELQTTLEFTDSQIVQKVDVPEDASYPVVADPAWTYAFSYNLYKKMKKPGKFTYIFPVSGAPKNFPKVNQKLPLKVWGKNFACIFQKEFYVNGRGGRTWGYQFVADKGHIDGQGSTIKFSVVEIAALSGNAGENRLWVDAWIKNTNPAGLEQWIYKSQASDTWSGFAAKIRTFA